MCALFRVVTALTEKLFCPVQYCEVTVHGQPSIYRQGDSQRARDPHEGRELRGGKGHCLQKMSASRGQVLPENPNPMIQSYASGTSVLWPLLPASPTRLPEYMNRRPFRVVMETRRTMGREGPSESPRTVFCSASL